MELNGCMKELTLIFEEISQLHLVYKTDLLDPLYRPISIDRLCEVMESVYEMSIQVKKSHARYEGDILGISGIIPKLGVDRPFYSFKRSRHARKASQQKLSVRYDTLQLTTDFDDYTELASIFLSPEARVPASSTCQR